MEDKFSIRESIGLKINELITKKKLTKSYIVEKLSISRPTLDDWIKGNVAISLESLFNLSKLMDVPVDHFFSEPLLTVEEKPPSYKSGNGNMGTIDELVRQNSALIKQVSDLIQMQSNLISMQAVNAESIRNLSNVSDSPGQKGKDSGQQARSYG